MNDIIVAILLTIIISVGLTSVIQSEIASKKVFQMGLCMEKENSDILRCQQIVDINYNGTNADK